MITPENFQPKKPPSAGDRLKHAPPQTILFIAFLVIGIPLIAAVAYLYSNPSEDSSQTDSNDTTQETGVDDTSSEESDSEEKTTEGSGTAVSEENLYEPEPAAEHIFASSYDGDVTCPADDQELTYSTKFSVQEDVDILVEKCSVTLLGLDFQMLISFSLDGEGYAIETEEDKPRDVTVVTASNLDVNFLESSDEKIKRLLDPKQDGLYSYTSYYMDGAENCSHWTGTVLACGVPGIALEDGHIDVSCTTEGSGTAEKCDYVLNTLSIE